MSQLHNALREAQRLLSLAHSGLTLKNLSEAREKLAHINGYSDWHSYEENLKALDFLKSRPSEKSIKKPRDMPVCDNYYNQLKPFIANIAKKNSQLMVIKSVSHKVIKLGKLKKKRFEKQICWGLNSYPASLIGTTGSGKTSVLFTSFAQWIENGEGGIYIDGKGMSRVYENILQVCEGCNRQKDLFVLSALSKNAPHSIDPINPLIGHEAIFVLLFGQEIGKIIHTIALFCKREGLLLDSSNIESMLMIPNLINWQNQNTFGVAASQVIKGYLDNLGLDNQEDAFIQHEFLVAKAKTTLDGLKEYETTGLFSIEPNVSIENCIAQNKILVIFYPAIEKNWNMMEVVSEIIGAQIFYSSQEISKLCPNGSNGNIIIDEASYSISEGLSEIFFKDLPRNINWIFSFQDYSCRNNSSILKALEVSNTVIMMKTEDPNDIPLSFIGRIYQNIESPYDIFYRKLDLKDLREGKAFVYSSRRNRKEGTGFSNKGDQDLLECLELEYRKGLRPESLYFNHADKIVKIEQSLPLEDWINSTEVRV